MPDSAIRDFVLSKERLDIPETTPKGLAELITACWAHDHKTRPTMAQVVQRLQPFARLAEASTPKPVPLPGRIAFVQFLCFCCFVVCLHLIWSSLTAAGYKSLAQRVEEARDAALRAAEYAAILI